MIELKKDEESVVSWYVHLLGNELQYIVLNSENIDEITKKGKEAFKLKIVTKSLL